MKFRSELAGLLCYQPGKPVAELRREAGISGEIHKLASNENCYGCSPQAQAAIRQGVESVSSYPDGGGYYLTQALADFYQVGADNIVLGNGSDELLQIIATALIAPGVTVPISNYSFIRYMMVTGTMGGQVSWVPMTGYRYNLEAMAAAIAENTSVVFIANPNNPTGTYLTAAEIDTFMDQVPDDVVVVFDEAYYEYACGDDYPDTIKYVRAGKNVIILRTFSKIYGLAGLRVGYGIMPPAISSELAKVRCPFNVNALAQTAALAALSDQQFVKDCRHKNAQQLEIMTTELRKLGIRVADSRTNFLMLSFDMPANLIDKPLLQAGFITRPLAGYGLKAQLRVSMGTAAQNQLFIGQLGQVLAAM